MRIAFITSEFSGLPGSGGIGSYFLQAAQCLVNAGHEVEVFTSGATGALNPDKGIVFHHLGDRSPPIFAVHAADAFAARHREAPFDILESAELKTEGLYAIRKVPDVAVVVRIHSPSVMLNKYLDIPPTWRQRVAKPLQQTRIALGAWRRGLPIPPIHLGAHPPLSFTYIETEEREAATLADVVIVMNEEMHRFAREQWWIKEEAITRVPNPIRLSPKEQRRPNKPGAPLTLGFIGRLEPRKGVLELARALKNILPRHPDWRVLFAGQSIPSCLSGADVGKMAREELKSFGQRVQFPGPVHPHQVDSVLADLDLCVFPSLWETFHYAVIEAMVAGKAIVATRTGAVVEMLDDGKAGMLVDPGNVRQLERALDSLMSDPALRQRLGDAAHQRAISKYSEASVTQSILEAYHLAIARRDRRLQNKPAEAVAIP